MSTGSQGLGGYTLKSLTHCASCYKLLVGKLRPSPHGPLHSLLEYSAVIKGLA